MKTSTAKRRAIRLIKKHNLLDSGWVFQFDKATTRFGCCNYTRKVISLSKPLVEANSWDNVKDTILHEIAHALTPGQNHNNVWKQKAIEIGCTGDRCYNSEEVNCVPTRYLMECSTCGYQRSNNRKPKTLRACGKCCTKYNNGKFHVDYILTMRKNPAYSGDYKRKHMGIINFYNEKAKNYVKGVR
jgi:predicted SprT family Zn-dependent metalloprotease